MDVTCERCGTEYEFDETLVSERGTTVKCTNCGHLFKVFRPGEATDKQRPWAIRKRGGATQSLTSLRELQRLIAQGELSEEDEISRSGEAWKPLGTIAELQTFFAAAKANRDGNAKPERRDGTMPFPTTAPDAMRADPRAYAKTLAAEFHTDREKTVAAAPDRMERLAKASQPAGERRTVKGTVMGLGERPGASRPAPSPADETFEDGGPTLASAKQPASKAPLTSNFSDAGSAAAARLMSDPPPSAASARPPSAASTSRPGTASPPRATGLAAEATLPAQGVPPPGSGPASSQPMFPPSPSVGATLPQGGSSPAPPAASPMFPPPAPAQVTTSQRPAPPPSIAGPPAPMFPPPAAPPTARPVATPHPGARAINPTRTADERPRHRTEALPSDFDYSAGDEPPPIKRRGTSTKREPSQRVPQPVSPRLYVDEEAERPPKRSNLGLFVGIGLLLIVVATGVVVALAWDTIGPAIGMAPADPVAEFIGRGDTAFARGDESGYRDAIREYTRASAHAENDGRVKTALARAHAALAQLFSFQASDIEALAARGTPGDSAAQRHEERTNAREARTYAEDAVALDGNNVAALLALADALRLTGDLESAESRLARAQTLAPDGSAEHHYVAGLMAMSKAENVAAARTEADAAVGADPAHVRARLLLARSLLAANDIAAARRQIDAVLDRFETQAEALSLQGAIDRGLPPAATVVATPDAGVAARDAGVDAGEATTGPVAEEDAARNCNDVDCLVRLGSQAQERGDVGRARDYFQRAIQRNPNDLEANAGLGAIFVDMGNPSAAVPYLQRAAAANYSDSAILLARAYRALGNTAGARQMYQQYLDRNPDGRYAAAARRGLEDLGGAPDTPPDQPPPDQLPPDQPPPDQPPPDPPQDQAPPTAPNELPAPRGTDPSNPPPSSDPLGME
jgi:predicted Zn finger-like uncharacterized protein